MTVRISNMTSTFANLEIVYNAISMDVTDTASDANSTLINLKVANTVKFSVRKDGFVYSSSDANIANTITTTNIQSNTANVQTATVNVATVTTGNIQALSANTILCESVTTNTTLVLTTAKTPLSAIDTGLQGQIAWDADYIYVCVANNVWKRSALTTWV